MVEMVNSGDGRAATPSYLKSGVASNRKEEESKTRTLQGPLVWEAAVTNCPRQWEKPRTQTERKTQVSSFSPPSPSKVFLTLRCGASAAQRGTRDSRCSKESSASTPRKTAPGDGVTALGQGVGRRASLGNKPDSPQKTGREEQTHETSHGVVAGRPEKTSTLTRGGSTKRTCSEGLQSRNKVNKGHKKKGIEMDGGRGFPNNLSQMISSLTEQKDIPARDFAVSSGLLLLLLHCHHWSGRQTGVHSRNLCPPVSPSSSQFHCPLRRVSGGGMENA